MGNQCCGDRSDGDGSKKITVQLPPEGSRGDPGKWTLALTATPGLSDHILSELLAAENGEGSAKGHQLKNLKCTKAYTDQAKGAQLEISFEVINPQGQSDRRQGTLTVTAQGQVYSFTPID